MARYTPFQARNDASGIVTQFNRPRLTLLLKHMQKVARSPRLTKAFDLRSWATGVSEPFQHYGQRFALDEALNCKTAGCVLGHATSIPQIRRLGLALVTETTASDDAYGHERGSANIRLHPPHSNRRYEGIAAGMQVFQISVALASWLFLPSHYGKRPRYKTPKDVVRRLKAVLDQRAVYVQFVGFSEHKTYSAAQKEHLRLNPPPRRAVRPTPTSSPSVATRMRPSSRRTRSTPASTSRSGRRIVWAPKHRRGTRPISLGTIG